MRFLVAVTVLCTAVSAVPRFEERAACNHDNCLRAFIGIGAPATSFCASYVPSMTVPKWASSWQAVPSRIQSACSCIYTAPASHSATTTSPTSSASTATSATPSTTSTTNASTGVSCTATTYSQIAPAVASCTAITLQDIYAPPNSSIDLSKVKPGTVVTFAGTTTFGFTNSSTFNPMTFGGKGVTITSAPGAIIDGNGQAYWDGLGSNGGVPK
jgi:polygalacturonase